MATIHPTALVDPSATLAEGVEVGAFCVVGPEVHLGEDTVLMDNVHVKCNTTMGAGNRVHPFAAIGQEPQDRKFHGEHTVLKIGDNNDIREHVTIHRGTGNGGGETLIGDNCLIMVGSHVAHDCVLEDHVTLANQVMLAGHVYMGAGSSVGGGAGLHHYATVGRLAFCGGLARVGKDVPPFMIAEGAPADVRGINSIGLVRAGVEQDAIDAIKQCYKRLFRDASGVTERIAQLRAEFADIPEVDELCRAVEASSAGKHGRAREAIRQDDRWSAPKQA